MWRRTSLVLATALVLVAAAALWWTERERAKADAAASALTRGQPDRATAHLIRFGCAACHQIPGVPGATGLVGPPLAGFGRRLYVGGHLPNTPDNLVRWLLDPRTVNPHTAMPATGISEQEARDVAAYLYART